MSAVVGLALLLGADIGSAVVVKVLLAKQAFMVPLLLVLGIGLFLRGTQRRTRQIGRILIGLALIFVSLDMIRESTTPLINNSGITAGMSYLGNDMATAFVIGALFTWVVHSSVAAVLFVVTLVSQGLLPQSAALAMVLGANLGGVIIAYVLTLSAGATARQMIIANALIRGGAAALVLALIGTSGLPVAWLGQTEAARVMNAHVVFNLAITLIALPVLKPIMAAVTRLLPDRANLPVANARPSALDPGSLDKPDRALICAAREILHMGEVVTGMLARAMPLYQSWNPELAAAIRAEEQQVRDTHRAVKLFLAQLNQSALDAAQRKQSLELSVRAMNMDAAADLVTRNLLDLAQRLEDATVKFSPEGWQELSDFHDRVLGNLQAALNVMMTQEIDAARALVAEKDTVRRVEQDLQRKHLQRLQEGSVKSIETSNIHQETLRSLKQLNAYFAIVAQNLLATAGFLLDSRLSQDAEL